MATKKIFRLFITAGFMYILIIGQSSWTNILNVIIPLFLEDLSKTVDYCIMALQTHFF